MFLTEKTKSLPETSFKSDTQLTHSCTVDEQGFPPSGWWHTIFPLGSSPSPHSSNSSTVLPLLSWAPSILPNTQQKSINLSSVTWRNSIHAKPLEKLKSKANFISSAVHLWRFSSPYPCTHSSVFVSPISWLHCDTEAQKAMYLGEETAGWVFGTQTKFHQHNKNVCSLDFIALLLMWSLWSATTTEAEPGRLLLWASNSCFTSANIKLHCQD